MVDIFARSHCARGHMGMFRFFLFWDFHILSKRKEINPLFQLQFSFNLLLAGFRHQRPE